MALDTRSPLTKAGDKLDNAWSEFIRESDQSGDAFVAAYDYRETGYAIAEAAMRQAPADREIFIDNECDDHDASAQYLIRCAAEFRLTEMDQGSRRIAA